jgi:hypothetical protein
VRELDRFCAFAERGEIAVNPCDKLRLPRSDRRRDRIADPFEGASLIAATAPEDRPLWVTAMYGGLRRGEIQALRGCEPPKRNQADAH